MLFSMYQLLSVNIDVILMNIVKVDRYWFISPHSHVSGVLASP